MSRRGAWGGAGSRGGYHRKVQVPAGTCACGGSFRWLPREERGFLVPGSSEYRCDRCGTPGPQGAAKNPVPPAAVAREARRGLDLRAKTGHGGTAVGVARARDLSNQRNVSDRTIRRMRSYFARHAVDAQAPGWNDRDRPSAGRVAWLLWGGDAGREWAMKRKKNPKARTPREEAILLRRVLARQEHAANDYVMHHSGNRRPANYATEYDRLSKRAFTTRLRLAALNTALGQGMAETTAMTRAAGHRLNPELADFSSVGAYMKAVKRQQKHDLRDVRLTWSYSPVGGVDRWTAPFAGGEVKIYGPAGQFSDLWQVYWNNTHYSNAKSKASAMAKGREAAGYFSGQATNAMGRRIQK